MSFMRLGDIFEQFTFVDDPDVLDRARTNHALARALEMIRPANWHGSGLRPEQVLDIATNNGIPVVWTPPAEVLKSLVEAAPDERTQVLLRHEAAVLSHCDSLLKECGDPWLEDERVLVGRALAAYNGGFHEAAMALAVAVGERLALWASRSSIRLFESKDESEDWERKRPKKKYDKAALELSVIENGARMSDLEVIRYALIGPIPTFFVKFDADRPETIPEGASRHATVHRPTVKHLSKKNALVVLMLCVSILREQQEWAAEVRSDDALREQDG